MHLLHLTFLFVMLALLSGEPTWKNQRVSPTQDLKPITANDSYNGTATRTKTNLIYQSMDGGNTWRDISYTLPGNEQPAFFAGNAGLYLRYKDQLYYSKSNLKTPVWQHENNVDPQYSGDHPFDGSIAFNPSGIVAYGWNVQVYQKAVPAGRNEAWSPVYPGFKAAMSGSSRNWVGCVFETSDGTIFAGTGSGLYKSTDKGNHWRRVIEQGWVANLVESNGVLMGTSSEGIMRSTDNGEHWNWVISEGGVGVAVESITGGFAAISYNTKTKCRSIHASFDTGKTWSRIDAGLSPSRNISSIKQIGSYLICGHPDGIFRSSDMGKTWIMVHGPVDNTLMASTRPLNMVTSNANLKVFNIYVSGNVVYAVVGGGGC
jgi:photosystem II stability/assembly factor-like uncharacterized protein